MNGNTLDTQMLIVVQISLENNAACSTRLSSHPHDVTLGYISAEMNVLRVFCGLTRSSNRLAETICHGESLSIILKRSTSYVRNYPPPFRV